MGGDLQACDRLTSAMRRGRCLDNVVVMSYGDGIMLCGEHIKAVIFYVEQHILWLPNEIMDKEEITFVLLAFYGWRQKIEHTGENIAIASPLLRRSVWEQRRRWITEFIRDIIT